MTDHRLKSARQCVFFAMVFMMFGALSLSSIAARANPADKDAQELVVAIPAGKIDNNLFAIYPIALFAKGTYRENKSDSGDDEQAAFRANRQAIAIIKENEKFMALSETKLVGTFSSEKIVYVQGLGCEYTFSPVGKMNSAGASWNNDHISILITENDRTKPSRIEKYINETARKKLLLVIAGKLKSFGLNIDRIVWENIKRVQMAQQQSDLVIAMTKTTLSTPRKFYESSREMDEITTLSIFHLKNGNTYPLYLPNPNDVIFTEFIWAGDIEGDGNTELILREVYGEFGRFVIFRFQQDRLIKIFEGTEYGC